MQKITVYPGIVDKIGIKVLVAPLDWGLGHATRCIPVIRALEAAGCMVWLAADGRQRHLLESEFPHLQVLLLPGYNISYAGRFNFLLLASQVPGILHSIRSENLWLKEMQAKHGFELIISDNRYGLYHPEVVSVLITHQLQLHLAAPWGIFAGAARQMIYRLINRFSLCWVPDATDATASLSGKLGHPASMPGVPVRYTGWLTRFGKGTKLPAQPTPYILVVLSGPEPQRTLLEKILINQLSDVPVPTILVRGLPGESAKPVVPSHFEVHNHLPANELEALMQHCKVLIARPGYSTVMDAFALGVRCIFVPTPGQTEQEYLGERLKKSGQAVVYNQDSLKLEKALIQANKLQPQNLTNKISALGALLQNALTEAFGLVEQKRQH
jgi:UDP:flavonoid glycosyltransferase YjiC (YdhE family)